MSDITLKSTAPRRKPRPTIKLPNDTAQPRADWCAEVGITEKTARRWNLPTLYISNIAYVLRDASLKILADRAKRRNEPVRRRGRR